MTRSHKIIEMGEWFATPAGRYMLAWEQQRLDLAVADIFGFHALQLGLPPLDALRANRMPHRWLAADHVWPSLEPVVGNAAVRLRRAAVSGRQPRSGRDAAHARTRPRPAPCARRSRARADARRPARHHR